VVGVIGRPRRERHTDSDIQVRPRNETVWLPQKFMAGLFQKDVSTINEHIRNILDEGEPTYNTSRPMRPEECQGVLRTL